MILIIGYGNPLRSDDGVGQSIARQLDVRGYHESVEVIACHQLTPELVEPISRADRVIFVDAAEQGQPGEIRCLALTPEVAVGAFNHHVSPAALLNAAHDLYGVQPKGIVISVTGVRFDYGEELSPPVKAVVPEVIARIHQVLCPVSPDTEERHGLELVNG